jgi:hypothetical protein
MRGEIVVVVMMMMIDDSCNLHFHMGPAICHNLSLCLHSSYY